MTGPIKQESRPPRDIVLRIATEEAQAAGARLGDVLSMARDGRAIMARRRAMLRILGETACTAAGLAEVWGCDRQIPTRLLQDHAEKPEPFCDAATAERLAWRYGPARAAQIVSGNDPNANRDLADWRRIGVHGRAT